METVTCSEFALHIHKQHGDRQHADLFTIGVWDNSVLRGICHAQPIGEAVVALRTFLQEAGRAVEVTQG